MKTMARVFRSVVAVGALAATGIAGCDDEGGGNERVAGSDEVIENSGAPLAPPRDLVATAVSPSQIDLEWADNSIDESGFRIERGTDGIQFDAVGEVEANVRNFSDTGLSSCTKYYFRVQAYNPATESGYSAVADASTGAKGELDMEFNGGMVTTAFGTAASAAAVAVQADGKIVVAGSGNGKFAVARYEIGGTLDMTFDGDGKVVTAIGSSSSANALALQPDGKIVAAGTSWTGTTWVFAVARYDTEGHLDGTFGGGVVTTAVGIASIARAVALRPDGKIVVAGRGDNGTGFGIARYNSDGTLDMSFDIDGMVTTAFGGVSSQAQALALQPDGKIVVAGESVTGNSTVGYVPAIALARYNSDGSLDTTFDGDGKVTTQFVQGGSRAYALALQPDGKIVVAGAAYYFAVMRYNTDGSLDTTFDGDGKVTTDFGNSPCSAHALALQPDGKIVAAGDSIIGGTRAIAVARYETDGALDTTFGNGGKLTTAVSSSPTSGPGAYDLALQPDGKIVAVGSASFASGSSSFAALRYR